MSERSVFFRLFCAVRAACLPLLALLLSCTYARADLAAAYQAYDAGRFAQARAAFEKLALVGDPSAQFNLAVMQEKGIGGKTDTAKALEWYKKAAAQDFAKAQYNLGLYYAQKNASRADLNEALRWFSRAAAQGMEDAVHNRDVLKNYLAADKQAPAQQPVQQSVQRSAASSLSAPMPPAARSAAPSHALLGGTAPSPAPLQRTPPPPLPALPQLPPESVSASPPPQNSLGFNQSRASALSPEAAAYVPSEVRKRYDTAIEGAKHPPKL